MIPVLTDFHLLRPLWLLAILPALLAAWWLYRQEKNTGSWQQVIAPELLPFLVDGTTVKQRRSLVTGALIAWLLATVAMSGPTWERTPLPVHKQENALVVLFDLSPSMLVQDLKPNRLTRARLKLIELLQQRKEGTTGLIAYAAEAFVVSPLTDDAATVAALVPALDPNIMPGHGSNIESAINQGIELVLNAGLNQADFLLITDDVSASARDELSSLLEEMGEFRLSVLGIGTAEGAPIPLQNGGFAKDNTGAIVIPRLDTATLGSLASGLGGRYSGLTADDKDIRSLSEGFAAEHGSASKQLERTYDSWHDLGYWLVLPLLPILLLAFRRGVFASILLLPLLSAPQPAMAFGWDDLWLTQDQQAARALAEGDAESAQQTFKDPDWKAAAAYRNGDFENAEKLYGGDTATAHYNRGNALAKAGKLDEALESYKRALSLTPDMPDAEFNRDLVEKLLEQQNNSPQNDQQQNNDNQNNDNQEQQQGSDQQQSQSDQQNQSSDQSQDGSSNQDQSSSSDQQSQDNPSDAGKNPDKQQQSSDGEQSQDGEQQSEQQGEQDNEQQPAQPQQEGSDQQGEQDGQQQPAQARAATEGELSEEEKQAMEQWLRKIPDDPGGLLREKFRYEAEKRQYEQRRGINRPGNTEQRW